VLDPGMPTSKDIKPNERYQPEVSGAETTSQPDRGLARARQNGAARRRHLRPAAGRCD